MAFTDQTDIAVPTVAYINEKLSLDGVGIDVADLFTDKYKMRQQLKAPGLFHPKFRLCKSENELQDFYESIKSDVIIKPVDSQSSRGVYVIKENEKIDHIFANSLKYSRKKALIVEEFINGIEITVEGFKGRNKSHNTLCVSRKSHFPHTFGVANSLTYEPSFDWIDRSKIATINDLIYEMLPFGLTHTEYIFSKKKLYLVEAAIRGGGTNVSSHIVPSLTGCDYLSTFIEESLFRIDLKSSNNKYIPRKYSYALLEFLEIAPGILSSFNINRKKIMKNLNILDFDIKLKPNHKINLPCDDSSRLGYYIGVSNSKEELNKLKQHVIENIKLNYDFKI
nr:ATP-grasp domain-containing protein [Prochlorococcus marinus]